MKLYKTTKTFTNIQGDYVKTKYIASNCLSYLDKEDMDVDTIELVTQDLKIMEGEVLVYVKNKGK